MLGSYEVPQAAVVRSQIRQASAGVRGVTASQPSTFLTAETPSVTWGHLRSLSLSDLYDLALRQKRKLRDVEQQSHDVQGELMKAAIVMR